MAFESADGDLYYTKEQELWKMPVRGGDERRVSASLFQNNFAPEKRGIYFVEDPVSSESTFRLQFLDLATPCRQDHSGDPRSSRQRDKRFAR